MPTISPTITVSSTPGIAITISAPGLTYDAFLNMLGVVVYEIMTIYYYTQQQAQFFNAIKYSQYDSDGNTAATQILTPIDPEQYQNTEFVELAGEGVFADGNSSFLFNLLPLNFIQFIFYAKKLQNEDAIDNAGGINNFKEVESAMGIEGFFEDPHDRIEVEFIPG